MLGNMRKRERERDLANETSASGQMVNPNEAMNLTEIVEV